MLPRPNLSDYISILYFEVVHCLNWFLFVLFVIFLFTDSDRFLLWANEIREASKKANVYNIGSVSLFLSNMISTKI